MRMTSIGSPFGKPTSNWPHGAIEGAEGHHVHSERSIPAVAVIGMAGRFPGGHDLGDFWALLRQGKSAVRSLSDGELREAGVDEALLSSPSYVKCCVPLAEADLFDATFFGYSPRQAASIDPQQRLFLEYAWEALERAGYGSIPRGVTAGVFGGSGYNGYLARSLAEDRKVDPQNAFQSVVDSDKDFITGRVAYKLGLTGPAVTVQTGCSTSLVAVHLASASLLNYECDIALAGGASVMLPPHTGYLHVEGGIQSRDGACRAYEADASGAIRGNGVAVLVLRRLADAQADGDPVLAIIRSTVVNNDGSRKVGFTAPGLESQVQLLRTGLDLAGLSPADIDFVEGHGTGTALGDLIELTALQTVYSSRGTRRNPCVLGSVKTNIGHTDTAAGVAGLIKTILSLRHRSYVPNAGFRTPNSALTSSESVFRVCSALERWPAEAGRRRRAAVSSFGVGGTNAHVIVEEAADVSSEVQDQQAELLPISARTHTALEKSCDLLAAHLDNHNLSVPDVAFTLQVGRRAFDHRRFVVGIDRTQIATTLRTRARRQPMVTTSSGRPVIFLFPGQGAQRLGMIADVYSTDREFAKDVDVCAEKVIELQGHDLRQVLCSRGGTADLNIDDTLIAQPAMLIVEYCLARFWMRQGLTPAAVLGHSVGEYAAAAVAGVFGIEDALHLIAHRARASRDLPGGAMIAVGLPEKDVRRLLPPSVEITAVNASSQCVVGGTPHAVREFAAELDARGIDYQQLAVSKPFHTTAAAPLAEAMLRAMREVALSAPRIPWVSSVTVAPMSDAESRSPDYWASHAVKPVRFAAALRALPAWEKSVFLEVGPGRVLTEFARREIGSTSLFVSLPPHAATGRADLLATLGELWLAGAGIEFAARPRAGRCRVELPAHPLERNSYLKAPRTASATLPLVRSTERLSPERWFNVSSWQRSLFPASKSSDAEAGAWLLLMDEGGLGESLAIKLRRAGEDVVCLRPGTRLAVHSRNEYELNVDVPEHFDEVFARLDDDGRRIGRIVHCSTLSVSTDDPLGEATSLPAGTMCLAQMALLASKRRGSAALSVLVITNRLHDISGYEQPCPSKAALPVFCRCIAQELTNTHCAIVDLPAPVKGLRLATQYARYENGLLAELESGAPTVAYRQDWRFVQTYSVAELSNSGQPLRELIRGGLYVITGGLGRLGLALGEKLARECQAKLLLVTRRTFPERSTWRSIAESGSSADATTNCARKLLAMEAHGAEVQVAAVDVSNAVTLSDAIAHAEHLFGPVRGVFHLAADLVHRSRSRRMAELDAADVAAQMTPKSGGLFALLEALGSRRIDFGVAYSSNSAVLGGVGYGAYAAANAIMDSMIASRADERLRPWISLNWDGWQDPGITPDAYAIEVDEGLDALWRVCCFASVPQLVVSATPFEPRFDRWVRTRRIKPPEHPTGAVLEAPSADATSKVLPRSALERQIAEIWQELLGIKEVGVTASFLEMGGDSLIGIRVISRIKEAFRINLRPASLLGQNSTVEALSREIVRAMVEARSTEVREVS
jgi:phthiocerol/phenolphthiocerol synthesis type-I polyketide synthase E